MRRASGCAASTRIICRPHERRAHRRPRRSVVFRLTPDAAAACSTRCWRSRRPEHAGSMVRASVLDWWASALDYARRGRGPHIDRQAGLPADSRSDARRARRESRKHVRVVLATSRPRSAQGDPQAPGTPACWPNQVGARGACGLIAAHAAIGDLDCACRAGHRARAIEDARAARRHAVRAPSGRRSKGQVEPITPPAPLSASRPSSFRRSPHQPSAARRASRPTASCPGRWPRARRRLRPALRTAVRRAR